MTPTARRHQSKIALALGLLMVVSGVPSFAQCLLANPSFEIGGSGGALFGGWNQFGPVASGTDAVHGQRSAITVGPDEGTWSVSGFWQGLPVLPGESWDITGHVLHPSARPIEGSCRALVNVEWRDAGGGLIDYDSFTVADSTDPTDAWLPFSLTSTPAPAGASEARLLVGVLQGPSDEVPEARFDQLGFHSTSAPSHDDAQWQDFPGGRAVDFAGRLWRVKGPGYYGPGPNTFCHTADCVWVDNQGHLHLTQGPHSTEVVLEEDLGYGDYIVTTRGPLDQLDPGVVLGLFLWEYARCWDPARLWWNPYNEIDIEYSRWCDPAADIGQFVAQPYDWSGNLERFDAVFGPDDIVSHAMRWASDRVEYRVWRGGPQDEAPGSHVHTWTYAGPHIPRPEQPRYHLNLWLFGDAPAQEQEIVFTDFRFTPAEALSAAPPRVLPTPSGFLRPPAPNPFNPSTTLTVVLDRRTQVTLAIHDPRGRLLRILHEGFLDQGEHGFAFRGKDDRGADLPSGVYLAVLKGPDFLESRRIALVK